MNLYAIKENYITTKTNKMKLYKRMLSTIKRLRNENADIKCKIENDHWRKLLFKADEVIKKQILVIKDGDEDGKYNPYKMELDESLRDLKRKEIEIECCISELDEARGDVERIESWGLEALEYKDKYFNLLSNLKIK